MAKTNIVINVQNGNTLLEEHAVLLGESNLKKWKLKENETVNLRYGSFKKEVKVVSVARLSALRLHEALANRLGLHPGARLCLQYKPRSRTIHLGPLIGVLVSRLYLKNFEKPFGATTAFCRELTDACAKYGAFIYFFTPNDIPPTMQTVHGWCYTDHWGKKEFPIPDVIYNRLTSRKLENKVNVQKFMKEAKSRYGAVVFNEKYLDKTEVFQALKKDASLHSYLPESYLLKNYLMLKTMLDRHSTLFLKPITGSLGKGIIRIAKISNTNYQCSYNSLNGVRTQTFINLSELFSSITGKIKHQRYQIQQGLKLIQAGGRPVDFRVLVQRNHLGEWSITSVVARTAGDRNFVSNLARGGSLSTVQDVVAKSNLIPSKKGNLHAKLSNAALQIAKGMDTQVPEHFAELGIDLAVDSLGKVWLIEVNSKPSKDDNTPLHDNKIRPSVIKVIRYSQFLAKF
jgi:hypothetical protein